MPCASRYYHTGHIWHCQMILLSLRQSDSITYTTKYS